ncbi:MAG TPA: bifunctional demethylmenaquinone methyltransferase/2-methoxy-6-polyprenyl-1,4-benzoquinol methylase, partial [Deltaproteobacteria bacterium]|nr:bifunctional demethylmenaquinone methyltransferase/2-methoxy-6-polyprenyl-1,4-benzoquinol methylase [Deltaproteobacteria bacterium]
MLDKEPQIIRDMFDRIASTYDLLNFVLSLSMDRRWRMMAVQGLAIKRDDVVLDIGTGTGNMALVALELSALRVLVIDLSRRKMCIARKKAKAMGLDNKYAIY